MKKSLKDGLNGVLGVPIGENRKLNLDMENDRQVNGQ